MDTTTATQQRLREALHHGWEGNPSSLVNEDWCWVTEARDPNTTATGPTGTVHRASCTRINKYTYLRPIRPQDVIFQKCMNCMNS